MLRYMCAATTRSPSPMCWASSRARCEHEHSRDSVRRADRRRAPARATMRSPPDSVCLASPTASCSARRADPETRRGAPARRPRSFAKAPPSSVPTRSSACSNGGTRGRRHQRATSPCDLRRSRWRLGPARASGRERLAIPAASKKASVDAGRASPARASAAPSEINSLQRAPSSRDPAGSTASSTQSRTGGHSSYASWASALSAARRAYSKPLAKSLPAIEWCANSARWGPCSAP